MKTIQVIITISTLLPNLFRICLGHSYILVPRGDFKTFNKAECRQGGPSHAPEDDCKGPCISKESWQYNKDEATTTYRRGQLVDMVWARNNHRGGFIRFTLVPESDRMNETAHDAFAFRYACYDSNKHECTFDTSTERRCGTDSYVHSTQVEIPTSISDGFYTLGFAWYGGIDFEGDSLFGDYWSCSRVRILGGLLTESYSPIFHPGEKMNLNNERCVASTDRLRDCEIEPCLGRPVFPRIPAKFANGQKPAPILLSWTDKTSRRRLPSRPRSPKREGSRSLPSPTPVAYISGLRLIDVKTNKILAKTFPRMIYIPNQVQKLSFIAKVRGDAEAVTFFINNEFIRIEKGIPFSAFGDSKGEVYSWPKPIYNKWVQVTVVATGKSGKKHKKIFDMYLKKGRKRNRR